MRGRPKKENARDNQYRLRMNDEELYILNYLSDISGITKADVIRKALLIYYDNLDPKLKINNEEK